MRPTEKALVARGIDTDKAKEIAEDGWTIQKLKQTGKVELRAIGLTDDFISKLFNEGRPPISTDVLMSVLFSNRYQCCICRNANLSVIVHHIDEWSDSRLHEIENLAVLCLHHHDQAHSKKTLSKNLDRITLRSAKQKWEEEVKRFDAESILAAMHLDYSSWNYINELRVFEIAKTLRVNLLEIDAFDSALLAGLVSADGMPLPVDGRKLFYKSEGPAILQRNFYVSSVFSEVIARLPIVNVSDYLEKGVLGFALVSGDFIFVQGAHTFSPVSKKEEWLRTGASLRRS